MSNKHNNHDVSCNQSQQKLIKFGGVKTTTQQTKPQQDSAPAGTPAAPLVRAEVIAKALDVNKRTVCLWAQKGTIPCVRIGGVVRFDLEAVLKATRR